MKAKAPRAQGLAPEARPSRAVDAWSPFAIADVSVDAVYESLVAFGAPLPNWQPRREMRLEEALPPALWLSHGNPTLLRVLPLVLARHAAKLDWALLEKKTQEFGQEAELGFLLELTAELTADAKLAERAARFEMAKCAQPRFYFEPRGDRDRRLVEMRTPPVARRWGFLLNMPTDSFRSLLSKYDAALQP